VWTLVRDRITMPRKWASALGVAGFITLYITFNTPNIDAWSPTGVQEILLTTRPFQVPLHIPRVEQALWLEKHTKPGARIAVTWAGITPYFCDRNFIDLFGKADKHIARLQGTFWTSSPKIIGFLPGHNKWDYAYSIGKLQPDVVAQTIIHTNIPYDQLTNYDSVMVGSERVYVKRGSDKVLK
jgi:hypothetical protein